MRVVLEPFRGWVFRMGFRRELVDGIGFPPVPHFYDNCVSNVGKTRQKVFVLTRENNLKIADGFPSRNLFRIKLNLRGGTFTAAFWFLVSPCCTWMYPLIEHPLILSLL